jgi:hypothetical protein
MPVRVLIEKKLCVSPNSDIIENGPGKYSPKAHYSVGSSVIATIILSLA